MLQHIRNNYNIIWKCCCSVAKLYPTLCPSLSHGVCSNSYLLSQRCHPTISSSVIFFSCPQSLPVSGSFPISWLFASGGQSIGALASASVLPIHNQGRFPFKIDRFDLLAIQGTLKVFSSTTVQKDEFFGTQSSWPAFSRSSFTLIKRL